MPTGKRTAYKRRTSNIDQMMDRVIKTGTPAEKQAFAPMANQRAVKRNAYVDEVTVTASRLPKDVPRKAGMARLLRK